jgi:hypothetical protein
MLCLALAAPARLTSAQTPAPPEAPTPYKLLVTVSDENSVAVPDALVLLQTSPSAVPLRCETDFAGRCQFVDLGPEALQLRVEKRGFYAVVEPNLQPSATSNVDVTLSHQQEVREVVQVVESPPAIDPAQVSSKEELSGLDIIDLPYPTTNDYRNVLNFIPGVVQDNFGQPHVAGAETFQMQTVLDGFNVTQPANGQLLVRMSTDAFRSIAVEPSREPAEYGKGSGGVLSLNTGIGDDHYRFVATDFTPSLQNKKGIALDQWTPRFAVSGPIKKSKIWFFDGADAFYDNFVIPQLPSGSDTDPSWRASDLAKLQANVSSRDILTTSFLFNYLDDPHEGLSIFNPSPTTPEDKEFAYVATVKDQHSFAGGELLEAGLNFDQYNLGLTPAGTSPYFISSGTAGGNYYLNGRTQARRWQALSNLYLAPRQWHGRHDLKLGVDLDRLQYDAQFARQPISFLSENETALPAGGCFNFVPPATPPCVRYSIFSGGRQSTAYNLETAGYIQDRWLVSNRLLLEPGLRLDWDQIVRHPLLAPRLAGTYVLDNSGNTKLSAGIGIVYDATPLFLIARPYAGQRLDYFFVNPSGNPLTTPTTVLTSFSANRNTLEAPRFLNWSLALEKKLPASFFLKAEFLQKRGTHGFVYDTANGQPGGNFLLQNTRQDHYDAFQLNLRRSFGKRYLVMGSYTRSRTRSNQVLDFNVDAPILSPQAPGPYPWDAPNRFLSWGLLPFLKLPLVQALDLAYSAEARTGFPFSVNNELQQLVGVPGSHRFPAYFDLNLHLEKRFHLFGYYWALRGGFDNITNHQNPYVVNTDVNSPQFLTFSSYDRRAFTSRIRFLGKK